MSDSVSKTTKRTVLTIATMASFLTPFVGSSINIALPSIGRDFNANAVQLGWVASAYLLTTAICLLPLGRLADMYGRRRVFNLGIWIYSFSSFLAAVTPGMELLIFARVLHGIGSAMIFSTGMAMVSSVFQPGERGRSIGFTIAAVYIGLSLGPTVGGTLIQWAGWRSIFVVNIALGVGTGLLSTFRLKGDWVTGVEERFDRAGSMVYGFMLAGIILGLGWLPDARGFVALAAGLAAWPVFMALERRAAHPVLHLELFRTNLLFAFSNLAALINYCATFAVGFLLSLYLQYIKGMTPQAAGGVLVVQPIIMALIAPLAGSWSDRIESRIVATIGMALNATGIACLAFLGPNTTIPVILAMLFLLGLGFALFASPNTNAVMSSVDHTLYGVASATLGTMRLVGQMLSMGVTMLVFSLTIGKVPIVAENGADFLRAMRIVYGSFAVLCLLGVPASLARGRQHARQGGTPCKENGCDE